MQRAMLILITALAFPALSKASNGCTKDTLGSCEFVGCDASRNATCEENKCVCGEGACAELGKCIPFSADKHTVLDTTDISEWTKAGDGPCRSGDGSEGHRTIARGLNSRQECRTACEDSNTCMSVEYTEGTEDACELHHYHVSHSERDLKCGTQCWTRKEGTVTKKWRKVGDGFCRSAQEKGNESQIDEDATNVRECQEACASVDVCVGFEYNPKGCELHMATLTTVDAGTDVVCYAIDSSLPTLGITSIPASAAAPADPSQTTTTKQWTLLGEGGCRPPSGEQGTGEEHDAANALECWQKCDQTLGCVAYDYKDPGMKDTLVNALSALGFGTKPCNLYKAVNHQYQYIVKAECGMQCWGLQSVSFQSEWRLLGGGTCRTATTKPPVEAYQGYTSLTSGECQHACASLDSCNGFETNSASGGEGDCELHMSNIAKFEKMDEGSHQCWCKTSVCGEGTGDNEFAQAVDSALRVTASTTIMLILSSIVWHE